MNNEKPNMKIEILDAIRHNATLALLMRTELFKVERTSQNAINATWAHVEGDGVACWSSRRMADGRFVVCRELGLL
jgi:hypothetical protein